MSRRPSPEAPPAAEAPTGVSGRPLSARGARTRRSLLDAAESVFAEHGYHDASIVKITQHAGVGQGTFYLYFPGKQEIFEELVADLNLRVRLAMAEGAAHGRTRLEKEELGFRAFFRFTARHSALYRVVRQAEFASPDALRRHYEAIAAGYVDGLRAAMDGGEIAEADPEVLAWALMAIGEMVGMRWIVWEGRRQVPDAVLDELTRMLRRLLGAAEPA